MIKKNIYTIVFSAAISAGMAGADPVKLIAEAVSAGRTDELPGFTLEIGTEDHPQGNDNF